MNHLMRELAPISERAWAEIDAEAGASLRHFLAARRIVDFRSPGEGVAALPVGRLDDLPEGPVTGVGAAVRRVQPVVELRTTFRLSRRELETIDRGGCDADLDAVRDAARRAAAAEDTAVFHGFAAGGVDGLADSSPHDPVTIDDSYERYPSFVAQGMATLKAAGVPGPYAIALGPRCYTGVVEQSEMGGYPVLEHLRLILGGRVVWAPAVDGAVILSQRGGDVELVCAEDFAVGYLSHDADAVDLFLEEAFTVQVCGPEAAIHLAYAD